MIFKEGQMVKVIKDANLERGKSKYTGKVLKVYKTYVLIQLKNFKECFNYADLRCGFIKVKIL